MLVGKFPFTFLCTITIINNNHAHNNAYTLDVHGGMKKKNAFFF